MAKFRVGLLESLIFEDLYVIQKKHWYGWTNWCTYYYMEEAINDAKELEKKGHNVKWYLNNETHLH